MIEGVVAMGFGIADESVALFGFGADSFIEVFSAVVILWRFRGEIGARRDGETRVRERKATLAIGVLFVLLCSEARCLTGSPTASVMGTIERACRRAAA